MQQTAEFLWALTELPVGMLYALAGLVTLALFLVRTDIVSEYSWGFLNTLKLVTVVHMKYEISIL